MNHYVPPPGFDPTILLNYRQSSETDVSHNDDSLVKETMVTEHDAEKDEEN